MGYRYLVLILGLVCFTLFPFFSYGDATKGADSSLAQTPKGLIPDQTSQPNPVISNLSPETKSGSNSPDPISQAPPAVKIQENTNAED